MTIYPTTVRGEKRWRLDYSMAGKRTVRTFRTRAEAEHEKASVTEQREQAGAAWASLRPDERAELLTIRHRAEMAGVTLGEVWAHWLQSSGRTEGKSLAEAVADLVATKTAAGRAPSYVRCLRNILAKLAALYPNCNVAAMSHLQVEEFLGGFPPDFRRTVQLSVGTLMNHAIRRGWRTDNPVKRIEQRRQEYTPPVVLTPEQVAAALKFLLERPRILGWFVLSALCGLRPTEAARTTWDSVTAEGLVRVEPQTSKIKQRRIVYPTPEARTWLGIAAAAKSELPLSTNILGREQRKLALAIGLPGGTWSHDLSRHTAATYWLARNGNPYEVAEQLGNSPGILKRHYRLLVTREEAERFWRCVADALPTGQAKAASEPTPSAPSLHPQPAADCCELPAPATPQTPLLSGVVSLCSS